MTAVEARPAVGHGGGRFGFGHLPALDGLRGAAVAAVLAYHLDHLAGGYLGVDLFFVLSGFLITSLLLAERAGQGRVVLADFWARRARRLLPALLLFLLGVAAFAQWIARPVDLDAIRGDALATLLYVANWHDIAQGQSYWDISLAPSPLQHTWSLAIEEQFYVLWPLAFAWLAAVATRRRAAAERVVLVVAGVGAALSAALLVGLHAAGASDSRLYQGTDTRAAALLLGAALAAWHRSRPVGGEREVARARAVGGVAALALGALWIGLDGTSPWLYRGGLAVASVLATVVIAAVVRGGGPLARALSVAPLRFLGTISYGLYLWHWLVFQAVDARNGRLPLLGDRVLDGIALDGLKLGLSFALALASFWLVEQPIRRSRWRGWPLLMASVGAMAVVGAVVVAATAGGVAVAGQQEEVRDPTVTVAEAPEVLYVGDSVSLSLVAPVAEDPAAFGVNPINRAYPGCAPVSQGRRTRNFAGQPADPPPCYRDLDTELPTLHPDVIFLLQGSRPNDEVEVDGRWVGACDPAWNQVYREAMADLVARLRTSGAPVVVGTIARTSANAAVQVQGSEENIACANRELRRVVDESEGTTLLDLNELVCPDPDGPCREEIDGDPIRPDGLHYGEGPAGREVARWALEHVLADAGLEPAPTTPDGGG
ncbi:MAG: acyltransferase family protein [Acidimicrobiales bacterium]